MPSFHPDWASQLWDDAQITRRDDVDQAVARILPHKARYQAVERNTGVPWFWMAATHSRESANNFSRNQLNGQPLGQVTTIVPKGLGPFKNWEESAILAVSRQNLTPITDWAVPRLLYEAERYNGWGYFGRVNSPYVWAGTNRYTKGKYVRDGVYDPEHVDQQLGVAAIFMGLAEQDEEVRRRLQGEVIPPPPPPPEEDDLEALLAKLDALGWEAWIRRKEGE